MSSGFVCVTAALFLITPRSWVSRTKPEDYLGLWDLTFYCCDARLYLTPFLGYPDLRNVQELAVFPSIEEFTISHPQCAPRETCATAIVGLCESQHALGIPFERVTVHMDNPPAEMVEKLRLWVCTVHCYDEPYGDRIPM